MDSRKLERIVILILLLLNVFLLAVVLSDSAQTRRSNAETAETRTALLEENGFTVADDAIQIIPAPPKCTLTRDMETEHRLISRLIGKSEASDRGGNIYFYTGTRGQAQLRGSGETDAIFESGSVSLRGGTERAALRLLRRCGISAAAGAAGQTGDSTVEVYATLDDIPVYNAVIRFDFSSGSHYVMSGTRVFDTAVKEESGGLLDSVSVLIRFVELVRDEGYICSRIDAVAPGYFQTVTRSGEAALSPVWRIETDAGAFLIDAESGKIENRLSYKQNGCHKTSFWLQNYVASSHALW